MRVCACCVSTGYGETLGGLKSGSTSQTLRFLKYVKSSRFLAGSMSRAQTTLDLSISTASAIQSLKQVTM
jgi:hypothetical protein